MDKVQLKLRYFCLFKVIMHCANNFQGITTVYPELAISCFTDSLHQICLCIIVYTFIIQYRSSSFRKCVFFHSLRGPHQILCGLSLNKSENGICILNPANYFIAVNMAIRRPQNEDHFTAILGYYYLRCYFDCEMLID